MNDKPKYRMLINPYTGKRIRMTETQIMSYANPPESWTGGTVDFRTASRIMAAQEWVKSHGEVACAN